jgi:hypothetical protein
MKAIVQPGYGAPQDVLHLAEVDMPAASARPPAGSWAAGRLIRMIFVVAVATVAAVGSGHVMPLRLGVGELYGAAHPRASAGSWAGGWRWV